MITKIMALFFLLLFSTTTIAYTHVHGYSKKNGTYVTPHYRTSPNHTKYDNWSTKGNLNPFTGKKGYKNTYNYRH